MNKFDDYRLSVYENCVNGKIVTEQVDELLAVSYIKEAEETFKIEDKSPVGISAVITSIAIKINAKIKNLYNKVANKENSKVSKKLEALSEKSSKLKSKVVEQHRSVKKSCVNFLSYMKKAIKAAKSKMQKDGNLAKEAEDFGGGFSSFIAISGKDNNSDLNDMMKAYQSEIDIMEDGRKDSLDIIHETKEYLDEMKEYDEISEEEYNKDMEDLKKWEDILSKCTKVVVATYYK